MSTDELTDIELTPEKWKKAFWLFKLKEICISETTNLSVTQLRNKYQANVEKEIFIKMLKEYEPLNKNNITTFIESMQKQSDFVKYVFELYIPKKMTIKELTKKLANIIDSISNLDNKKSLNNDIIR